MTTDSPSRESFSRMLVDAFTQAGFEGPISYDPKDFKIQLGSQGIINLTNVYNAYCTIDQADREEWVQGLVASLQRDDEPSFDQVAQNLTVIVRSTGYPLLSDLSARVQQDAQEGIGFVYKPLAPGLVMILAIDQGDSLAIVRHDQLEDWQVDADDALSLALENLRSLSTEPLQKIPNAMVFAGGWGDGQEASRLVLTELFDGLPVNGRPVVLIPTVGTLLVAGEDDPQALVGIASIANQVFGEGERPVTGEAYILTEVGQWERFMPDPEHPARGLFRKLFMNDCAANYQDQQALLEKHYEKVGEDIFCAGYNMAVPQEEEAEEEGSAFSWAVVLASGECNFPRVDFVAIASPDPDADQDAGASLVPWDDFSRTVGSKLVELQGFYPPRYTLDEPLTQSEFEILKSMSSNG
jgi:uncharacterized protein YtpQ (UPF0354 family)